jgi:hypothetical protein
MDWLGISLTFCNPTLVVVNHNQQNSTNPWTGWAFSLQRLQLDCEHLRLQSEPRRLQFGQLRIREIPHDFRASNYESRVSVRLPGELQYNDRNKIKGTVAWDFCALVLFSLRPHLGPCLLYHIFIILFRTLYVIQIRNSYCAMSHCGEPNFFLQRPGI